MTLVLSVVTPAQTTDLLPVTVDCPGLGSTLLFNSAVRAIVILDPALRAEPDWCGWMQEITQADHIAAVDLLVPEKQLGCQLMQCDVAVSPGQARQAYRSAYWRELAQNQSAYFRFFERWGVPDWILQSLRSSCEQEELVRRFGQALAQIDIGPRPRQHFSEAFPLFANALTSSKPISSRAARQSDQFK